MSDNFHTENIEFKGGREVRIFHENHIVLQIERYEGYDTAYWKSGVGLTELIEIVRSQFSRYFSPLSPVTYTDRYMERDTEYQLENLFEFTPYRLWPYRGISFVRVDGREVSVTWEHHGKNQGFFVGAIFRPFFRRELEMLYRKTSTAREMNISTPLSRIWQE